MKLAVVKNKEIANRLNVSASTAGRLVRAYRDARQLPPHSPIVWDDFARFYGLPVNEK